MANKSMSSKIMVMRSDIDYSVFNSHWPLFNCNLHTLLYIH